MFNRSLQNIFSGTKTSRRTFIQNNNSYSIVSYLSGRTIALNVLRKIKMKLIYYAKCVMLPAIFRSRIFLQMASAFRIGQFSIFVEKLRKKRYSFRVTDIRRAIAFSFSFFFLCWLSLLISSLIALTIIRQFQIYYTSENTYLSVNILSMNCIQMNLSQVHFDFSEITFNCTCFSVHCYIRFT